MRGALTRPGQRETTMSIQTTRNPSSDPTTRSRFAALLCSKEKMHTLSRLFLSVRVASPRVFEENTTPDGGSPTIRRREIDSIYLSLVYCGSCYTTEIKTARESAKETRGEGRRVLDFVGRVANHFTNVGVIGSINGDIAV